MAGLSADDAAVRGSGKEMMTGIGSKRSCTAVTCQCAFMPSNLLELDGQNLRDGPLEKRRNTAQAIIDA